MNNQQTHQYQAPVAQLRQQYRAGTRVKLAKMDDPYSDLHPGDLGTVALVDDIGTIHIDWDNGSTLGVVYGIDRIRIIPPTGFICHRCKSPAYLSENPEYRYQCFTCDEDLYSMEIDPDPHAPQLFRLVARVRSALRRGLRQ